MQYDEQEKAAIKETLKAARKLFARLGELTADPVATLAKKDVQNEITDLFTNMFASSIAEQLAMPVARGIVTIFTRGIQEITILENVTCDQFVECSTMNKNFNNTANCNCVSIINLLAAT